MSRRADRTLALSQALGVAAAIVIAVLVNLLGARHYRRWDWTSEGLYTLSRVTEETLSSLPEPVEVWVLSSDGEPITLTLRHLLTSYRARNDRLVLHFIDPDTAPAELFAAQQKLGIVAGKSENGHVVTDATVVIVRGDRKHYLGADELVSVDQGAEMRVRPQVEKMLTAGLREVLAGEPVTICVTTGHGEASLDAGGEEGLAPLAQRLTKSNFRVIPMPPAVELEAKDPIGDCALVVVAAPKQRLPKADVERLRLHLTGGGNVLLATGPLPDDANRGFVSVGLEPVLAAGSLKLRQELVFERDAERRAGAGQGEMFLAKLSPHPATMALSVAGDAVPIVVMEASSLEPLASATTKPEPLLETTSEAFGMTDVFAWAASGKTPEPGPNDSHGPLRLGYAVELPKAKPAAERGARFAALASASFLAGRNWTNPQLQGTALFVESLVSWLASKTVVLDIPDKRGRPPVGLQITEDVLKTVLLEVVVLMPLGVLGIGVLVRWRRNATEARSRAAAKNAAPRTNAPTTPEPPASAEAAPPEASPKKARARKAKAQREGGDS
ncbi:MAG: GldG family protein [Deltaproteobacteria bacterium]|nr:GldG family protein [Deltaproteobacteria bacterium]